MSWLNPWREIARLRDMLAAGQHRAMVVIDSLRADNAELRRAADEVRVERDAAWAKLERRSRGVARGNITRARRRRGGLLPAPINHTDASTGDQRNTSSG